MSKIHNKGVPKMDNPPLPPPSPKSKIKGMTKLEFIESKIQALKNDLDKIIVEPYKQKILEFWEIKKAEEELRIFDYYENSGYTLSDLAKSLNWKTE